mgnify:CR=1 FL=1
MFSGPKPCGRIVGRAVCDETSMEQDRHAELLRPFVERIVSLEVVRIELFVRFQADEAHLAECIDPVRFVVVQVEETEGEEESVVPLDRVEQLLPVGQPDVVE